MTGAPARSPAVGRGHARAHYGEVLQGVFPDESGRLVVGVVSLPLAAAGSHASFAPGPEPLTVRPAWKVKALSAARATLDRLGDGGGGRLWVADRLPVGRGFGSSTADVVSAIRAVAAALDRTLSPDCVAALAVGAEGACDPVMFTDRAVLFASREGRVLRDLSGPLPVVEVLGFDDGPPVDTLGAGTPSYSSGELAGFAELSDQVAAAVRAGSASLLGEVATHSARVNQRHRPKPGFELACRVASASSALGVQAAHTGSLLALLYDPADPDLDARIARAGELLRAAGVTGLRRFRSANGAR